MITRLQLEVATGAITGAFAVAVIVSSIGIGSGWSSAGVESGTFPLLAGVLILLGSLVNVGRAFLEAREIAIDASELRRIGGLFLPAAVFVALIPAAGIYLAAAGYVLYTNSVQHKARWWRSALIALGTVLTLYFLFERTFQVALPHGWIGNALGF